MKINLKSKFTLETEDKDYEGYYSNLNKKELKAFKKKFSKYYDITAQSDKLYADLVNARAMSKVHERLEEWAEVKKCKEDIIVINRKITELETTFKDDDATEELYKERLMLSVSGDDKEAIIALGELYGYEYVNKVINEDIAERKKKEKETS